MKAVLRRGEEVDATKDVDSGEEEKMECPGSPTGLMLLEDFFERVAFGVGRCVGSRKWSRKRAVEGWP